MNNTNSLVVSVVSIAVGLLVAIVLYWALAFVDVSAIWRVSLGILIGVISGGLAFLKLHR